MLIYLLTLVASTITAPISGEYLEDAAIYRRVRKITGHRASQIGAYSCFRLQQQYDESANSDVIDARIAYLEADMKEIPTIAEVRDKLERSVLTPQSAPICIRVDAHVIHAEVVLYLISNRNPEMPTRFEEDIMEPSTMPSVVVPTKQHWLRRFEEIQKEADPNGDLMKSAQGPCRLIQVDLSIADLIPNLQGVTPATFKQGRCRGGCIRNPRTRTDMCCKHTKMSALEFSYIKNGSETRIRRINNFIVEQCGYV